MMNRHINNDSAQPTVYSFCLFKGVFFLNGNNKRILHNVFGSGYIFDIPATNPQKSWGNVGVSFVPVDFIHGLVLDDEK